ncbi:unnamed protein product [Choristocarpus tenellus]
MDTLGSVVMMRSRFENVIEAHSLLLSPLNGIQSHFRSSYSMVIGVLRSKDFASAKVLVEKSFGSFLRLKRLGPAQKSAESAAEKLEEIKAKLQGVQLSDAKFYHKLWERLQGEEEILAFLKKQHFDGKVSQKILDAARLGSGLLLADNRSAAFLGDFVSVTGSPLPTTSGKDDEKLFVLVDGAGMVEAVHPAQVQWVEGGDTHGINPITAAQLAATLYGSTWEPKSSDDTSGLGPDSDHGQIETSAEGGDLGSRGERGDGLAGILGTEQRSGSKENAGHTCLVPVSNKILEILEKQIKESGVSSMPPVPEPPMPKHILRQISVMERVRDQMEDHPVHSFPNVEEVIAISGDIIGLEKKVRSVKKKERSLTQSSWEQFKSVSRVLMAYDALEEVPDGAKPTQFGEVVGSINAENELWIALVLTMPTIVTLSATELAGLMPAILNESTRSNLFSLYGPSDALVAFLGELVPLASELVETQFMEQAEQPVRLDGSICGLVEGWANGCTWKELMESTSLDEGDLCRILRRSLEMLGQIPSLPGVPGVLKDRAREAAAAIDRFPVSDDMSFIPQSSPTEKLASLQRAGVEDTLEDGVKDNGVEGENEGNGDSEDLDISIEGGGDYENIGEYMGDRRDGNVNYGFVEDGLGEDIGA